MVKTILTAFIILLAVCSSIYGIYLITKLIIKQIKNKNIKNVILIINLIAIIFFTILIIINAIKANLNMLIFSIITTIVLILSFFIILFFKLITNKLKTNKLKKINNEEKLLKSIDYKDTKNVYKNKQSKSKLDVITKLKKELKIKKIIFYILLAISLILLIIETTLLSTLILSFIAYPLLIPTITFATTTLVINKEIREIKFQLNLNEIINKDSKF